MRTDPFSKNLPVTVLPACCANTGGAAAMAVAVTPAFSILRLIGSIFGVLLTFGRLTSAFQPRRLIFAPAVYDCKRWLARIIRAPHRLDPNELRHRVCPPWCILEYAPNYSRSKSRVGLLMGSLFA